jgi:FkbM family methyltransferase
VKNKVKYLLQKILGYENYLLIFAHYKIVSLERDKKEGDFFYFMDLLKNPACILDLGANIGVMTTHLSNRFKTAKIYAVEPMPSNLKILHRIVKRYKLINVSVLDVALGNKTEKVQMVLPQNGKTKMQGLSHVVHKSIKEWNKGEQIEVPCTTLDKLFKDEMVQGIKMDVENFEFFVLEGGKKLIERSQPIIYTELWENENRLLCLHLLKELNYTPYVVNDGKLTLYVSELHRQQNFIFIPKSYPLETVV